MNEQTYEKLLNITTTGHQNWDKKHAHYHPYESTCYLALDILFQDYRLESRDHVVDFGCGKGRLIFYINHFFKSNVTGVEMDEILYLESLHNKSDYLKKHKKSTDKVNFFCCLAEDYQIKPQENKFYFFNPFTIQIFRKIVENILLSVEKNKRKVQLILYYPSDDYIYYLDNHTSFTLFDQVVIEDLYKKNPRERFLIYQLD